MPRGSEDHAKCPTCGVPFIADYYQGEKFCEACGFVASDPIFDEGPEWKVIDPEERQRRARSGPGRTLTRHDYGLSTDIDNSMRDSRGHSLDSSLRASANRLIQWHSRMKTTSSEERSLALALTKMNEICDVLALPRVVRETASHIYRLSAKFRVARSLSITGMVSAAIYLACRECDIQRTLKDLSAASGLDKRAIARYYRLMRREVAREYVPLPTVDKYINKFVNTGGFDGKLERLALRLSSNTLNSNLTSGKSPNGLAAAYIYLSSVMLGQHIPQREIAQVADVTEVTVRSRCKDIIDNYVIRQHLNPSKEGTAP